MLEFLSEFAISIIENFGYTGITFLMFLESSFIPIPSEIVMPFSGFVASKGSLNFWAVVFFGIIGQMAGASALYFFGRWEGRSLLEKYGKYILVRKKDIDHADKLFEKHGEKIVLFGRLLPGIRMVVSLPAGISRMSYLKFLTYSTLGIIPFTLALAYLGVKLGENWAEIKSYFHYIEAAIILVVIYFIYKYIKSHLNKKASKGS